MAKLTQQQQDQLDEYNLNMKVDTPDWVDRTDQDFLDGAFRGFYTQNLVPSQLRVIAFNRSKTKPADAATVDAALKQADVDFELDTKAAEAKRVAAKLKAIDSAAKAANVVDVIVEGK